jgi:DNA-binding response OmpR family regulator
MDEKLRILVVDDEQKVLNIIQAYLIKEGFKALTSSDGEEALNIFKNEQIHLIILDLMLPKISLEELSLLEFQSCIGQKQYKSSKIANTG